MVISWVNSQFSDFVAPTCQISIMAKYLSFIIYFVAPTCWNDPINTRSCRGAKLVRGRTFKAPIVTVAGKNHDFIIKTHSEKPSSKKFAVNFLHFVVNFSDNIAHQLLCLFHHCWQQPCASTIFESALLPSTVSDKGKSGCFLEQFSVFWMNILQYLWCWNCHIVLDDIA